MKQLLAIIVCLCISFIWLELSLAADLTSQQGEAVTPGEQNASTTQDNSASTPDTIDLDSRVAPLPNPSETNAFSEAADALTDLYNSKKSGIESSSIAMIKSLLDSLKGMEDVLLTSFNDTKVKVVELNSIMNESLENIKESIQKITIFVGVALIFAVSVFLTNNLGMVAPAVPKSIIYYVIFGICCVLWYITTHVLMSIVYSIILVVVPNALALAFKRRRTSDPA